MKARRPQMPRGASGDRARPLVDGRGARFLRDTAGHARSTAGGPRPQHRNTVIQVLSAPPQVFQPVD